MVSAFLFVFTVTLIVVYLTKHFKLSKHGELGGSFKRVEQKEEVPNVGYLRIFREIIKLPYYQFIEAIPNYEVGQRLFNRLGKNIRLKFPFRSTEYMLTADPVYAKRIMADPSWPERVPVGYYVQDAGFHKPYGLLLGGGKHWKPASRITAKLLQQLGFFNAVSMEGRFVFEMEELERKFDAKMAVNGGEHTFSPADVFNFLSINVVFHILLGKRNPFDEAMVTKLINSIVKTNQKMTPVLTILELLPFLRHFPKLTFMKYLHETSHFIYDVLREVIAEKRQSGKYKEHVEDFVDGMLQHVDKNDNSEDGLNEENMLVVLREMLFAGADTTSATLEHALLLMAMHPEVQEKVQAEIDGVVGTDRAPAYEDRKRMPYTEATLHEIYRIGTPIPGIGRAKHKDGACSFLLISLYGVHRNEEIFDEPNKFKPERFLDKDDPTKVAITDNLIPFGYGRRSCPGESAARVAVFVYFVVMLQKYSIRLSSQHPPPSMKNTNGFSRSPFPYFITIKKRH